MKKKNLVTAVLGLLFTLCITAVAFAAEAGGGAEVATAAKVSDLVGMAIALGASLCIGIAALGGGMAQGKAISSALDGIARNPGAAGKVMTPMIIGLAMIESLVIYALVVSLILVGKL